MTETTENPSASAPRRRGRVLLALTFAALCGVAATLATSRTEAVICKRCAYQASVYVILGRDLAYEESPAPLKAELLPADHQHVLARASHPEEDAIDFFEVPIAAANTLRDHELAAPERIVAMLEAFASLDPEEDGPAIWPRLVTLRQITLEFQPGAPPPAPDRIAARREDAALAIAKIEAHIDSKPR